MADVKRKYAISEVTTIRNSFQEDVALYARSDVPGIGVWGFKMDDIGPDRASELLRRHGLKAANCIPELNSIMPYVLSPEPADPMQRVEGFLRNLESMAKLEPESIVVITGPAGDRSHEEAWDLCVEGFERIGQVADDLGVTIALEPVHRSESDVFTILSDIPQTLQMLDQLNRPNMKILFDTWHLWDTDNIYDLIAQHGHRIGGVHIADWKRGDTRTWADRAFPGEGKVPILAFVDALEAAGFDGHFDVEIFSDDGRFGTAHPDTLWDLPCDEIVSRATALFRGEARKTDE